MFTKLRNIYHPSQESRFTFSNHAPNHHKCMTLWEIDIWNSGYALTDCCAVDRNHKYSFKISPYFHLVNGSHQCQAIAKLRPFIMFWISKGAIILNSDALERSDNANCATLLRKNFIKYAFTSCSTNRTEKYYIWTISRRLRSFPHLDNSGMSLFKDSQITTKTVTDQLLVPECILS